jgi:hypothetical protein
MLVIDKPLLGVPVWQADRAPALHSTSINVNFERLGHLHSGICSGGQRPTGKFHGNEGLTAVFADLVTCCKSKVDGVGILGFNACLVRKVRHQCDEMLSAANDSDTPASQ